MQPGQVLHDRYVIERRLRQGVAADVFSAYADSFVETRVAVVRVPGTLGGTPAAPHDMTAFSRACARLVVLAHPGLIEVIDYFSEGRYGYLIYPLIPGRTLRDILAGRGPRVTEARIVGWLTQITDTLAYLHGLVPPCPFRDLTADNVVIDERDHARLVLYQPVRFMEPAPGKVTDDLASLGTLAYTLLAGPLPPGPAGPLDPALACPGLHPALRALVQRLTTSPCAEPLVSVMDALRVVRQATTGSSTIPAARQAEATSPVPPPPEGERAHPRLTGRVVTVLFLDIVGYSRMHNEGQLQVRSEVGRLLRECPQVRGSSSRDVYVDARAGDAAVVVFFENLLGPVEAGLHLLVAARTVPHLSLRLGLHVGTVLVDEGGVPVGEALTVGQFIASACEPGGLVASAAYVDMLASVTDRYSGMLDSPRDVVRVQGKRVRVVDIRPGASEAKREMRTPPGPVATTELRLSRAVQDTSVWPVASPDATDPGLAAARRSPDATDPGLAAVPRSPVPSSPDATDPGLAAVPRSPAPSSMDATDPGLAAVPRSTAPSSRDVTDPGLAAVPRSPDSASLGATVPNPLPRPGDLTTARTELAPPPAPVLRYHLEVVQGPAAARRATCTLGKRVVVVGRAACDLVVDDPGVSRRHFTIYPQAGSYWLHHESAVNPTLVNDVPVTEDVELAPGDRIRLGHGTLLRLAVSPDEITGPGRSAAPSAR